MTSSILIFFVLVLLALFAGFLLGRWLLKNEKLNQNIEQQQMQQHLLESALVAAKEGELKEAKLQIGTWQKEAKDQQEIFSKKEMVWQERLVVLEKERATLERDLAHAKETSQKAMAEEQQKALERDRVMRLEFEKLAQKIFEEKQHSLQQVGQKGLEQVLDPFKTRLQELQKKIEETYEKEGREVFSLRKEIQNMMDMGRKMEEETKNLTQALKGDVKMQGNWGEFVLEKILESSGLRAGEEYITQGSGMGLKGEEGNILRPDVIINLPDGKNLIIDSKVSLVAYDRLISAEDESEKDKAKKEFLTSVKNHIDMLASKNYQDISGLKTPDFVFMFAPIEGALSLILSGQKDLFNYGWDKKVIIVGPTTLLATLRTVATLWKQERQHRNALQIAEVGGRLYDKFATFVDDLDKMGDNIKKLHDAHEKTVSTLKTGRGNVLAQVDKLRVLGVKATKKLKDVDPDSSSEDIFLEEPNKVDVNNRENHT